MKKLLLIFLICSGCHKEQPTQKQSQPAVTQSNTKEIKFIVDATTDSTYIAISNFDYPNSVGLLMNNFSHTFITNQPQAYRMYVLNAYDTRTNNSQYSYADTIRIRAYLGGILQTDTRTWSGNTAIILY